MTFRIIRARFEICAFKLLYIQSEVFANKGGVSRIQQGMNLKLFIQNEGMVGLEAIKASPFGYLTLLTISMDVSNQVPFLTTIHKN